LLENRSSYYPEILASIQELGEVIDVLKKRNSELKSRVSELESKILDLQEKQLQPGLFDNEDNQRLILKQQVNDCISRIDRILDLS
jgi:uncharacterized protein Yka (UPF0111/DUF47 family)